VLGFTVWAPIARDRTPTTPEVITVVGARLAPDSLGAVEFLRDHPDLMARLMEPFTVAVDESDLGKLGVRGVGDQAEVTGKRVRVVGLVRGCKSLGGPYVFCSTDTARVLVKDPGDGVTYFLAKCPTPADATAMAARMNRYPTMSAFTAADLSLRSRMHWLFTTKVGIAMGFTALLGLLVGGVVTSQTLYAATAASQREFATMRAMGIPGWRLRLTVVEQSFWVGLFGIAVAAPLAVLMAHAATEMGTAVRLHPLVLLGAAGVTLAMSLLSGLAALRSFQSMDPAHNIR
ncbi:MAG: ABC transporter permease, partial [Fimbriiglobus sp.]